MFRNLLIASLLILAGCGGATIGAGTFFETKVVEVDGHTFILQERTFDKSKGPYYSVVFDKNYVTDDYADMTIPFSPIRKSDLAIKAIEQDANCKVDHKTVQVGTWENYGKTHWIKPGTLQAKTICQVNNEYDL